ncbi:MAG: hypothetical protein H6700_09225 [Myxococcales bacterium]|nr:hypothetical protein [Myxococcales bacterium]MCB9531934.1 hypothetical protein [Myxococcales bacterium]
MGVLCGALAGAAGGACGGRPPTDELDTAGVSALALVASSSDGPLDLSGRWARLVVTTAESEAPLVGTVTTVNRTVGIVDLVQDGDGLTGVGRVCTIDVETSSSMASTVVPDAFVASLPERSVSGVVVAEGDGSVVVELDRAWEWLGLTGVDEDDALPDSIDDGRVVDADGDGHPGVTIEVTGMGGGEMYFVQRAWRELHASTVSSTQLDGEVVWASERVVLDATSRPLRANRPSTPILGADASYFRSTRIPADATCSDIAAAGPALFARGGS